MSINLHKMFKSSGFEGMTKRQMSALLSAYTNRFVREGGVVKVGQPAFAVGCEMSSNVRSLIRRDQRLSLG